MRRWIARTTLVAAIVGSMATSSSENFEVRSEGQIFSLGPGERATFEIVVVADETILQNPVAQSVEVFVQPLGGEEAKLSVALEPLGFSERVVLEGPGDEGSSSCNHDSPEVESSRVTESGTFCFDVALRCCEAFYQLSIESRAAAPMQISVGAKAVYDYTSDFGGDEFVPEPEAIQILLQGPAL